jgi:hypothetical protein
MAAVGTAHEALSGQIAAMMSEACGRSVPRPHLSFFALGGTETQARELTATVNSLFALDLPADAVMRSPTPDALARTIETAWDGSPADLSQLVRAIAGAA